MSITLPESTRYGRVRGSFIRAKADNTNTPDDVDELPDALPAVGTITFDPAPTLITLDLSKDIVIPDPIVVDLDASGQIDEWLVANTNSNPSNWTYEVSFNIIGVTIAPFNIEVTEGADLNLFDFFPAGVVGDPGVLTLRGAPGDSAYQVAVNNGFVGTEQQWLDSLGSGGGGTALQDHIDNATPHPAYDIDLPDLAVLFENGLI